MTSVHHNVPGNQTKGLVVCSWFIPHNILAECDTYSISNHVIASREKHLLRACDTGSIETRWVGGGRFRVTPSLRGVPRPLIMTEANEADALCNGTAADLNMNYLEQASFLRRTSIVAEKSL